MGLDCYASRISGDIELTDEDEAAFSDMTLCGGILSDGCSSFRGKVYWDIVYAATQMSIHDDLSPREVRRLARRLNAYTAEELVELSKTPDVLRGPHSLEECASLQRWFSIAAERGLWLVASS